MFHYYKQNNNKKFWKKSCKILLLKILRNKYEALPVCICILP